MYQKSKKKNEELSYSVLQGAEQAPHLDQYMKETESNPIIAVALSPEAVDDVLRKIEAKIAEYEQYMNS